MYTRKMFGIELKERVFKQQKFEVIGEWAFSIYWEHIEDIDFDFRNVLLTLNKMELGEEFAYSYERLNEIADDLIAGKIDINLDY